ncbi:porin family protein [Hymenobacter jeollabukensis]|uniref:PorT family protein n=1 Tax=Hymenobacter jeollabukensis TaxID=2025313 RepID=A0A5R8WHU6_9BACT|nr:porin family protein [Hymenobacter jeollabukensis]TLM88411.1 PorT family protein [Hymenobacter jeollabukensis]
MKSALILLGAALLLSPAATAQQLRFGAKVGLNYSDSRLRGVTNDGTEAIFSYHLGAVGRYSFGPDAFWNVQAELLYSRKGDNYTPRGGTGVAQRRLNYLDLPVLAKINAHGLMFEAGPQIGYLVGASYDTGAGTSHDRSGFRPVQLGYVAGVGYELPSGYSLTIRYNGDAFPITKGGGFLDGPAYSVFQAQFGYLLGGRQ